MAPLAPPFPPPMCLPISSLHIIYCNLLLLLLGYLDHQSCYNPDHEYITETEDTTETAIQH